MLCRRGALLCLAAVVLLSGGCGSGVGTKLKEVLPGDDTRYRSSRSLPPLEVPPDLSSGSIKEGYEVPGLVGPRSAKYSDYVRADHAQGERGDARHSDDAGAGKRPRARSSSRYPVNAGVRRGPRALRGSGALAAVPEVRLARSGDKRWLVIKAPRAQVWPRVRDFLLANGFTLATDDAGTGIMETDWAEKQSEPKKKGFMGALLSRFRKSNGGVSTRDRFRVRLEQGRERDSTEIYLSHRAAERAGDRWQPRPPDRELEAEMLDRLMAKLGVEQRKATRLIVSGADRNARAHLVRDRAGGTALALRASFSRAWQRTGLALGRIGIKVQQRDRSRGLYLVRYAVERGAQERAAGWMSKLKSWLDDKQEAGDRFLISLVGGETVTRLVVLNGRGERDQTGVAERIIALLHQELR